MTATPVRQTLFPNVRRSPYFVETVTAGATSFMVYNHTYMPVSYGRDERVEYEALTTRVTLWDVGAERQTALTGRDAVRLADYLATRNLSNLDVGQCRFTMICDEQGTIMTEPIVLRPFGDTVWISHGDVDLTLWARATATHGGFAVTVDEPDVAPMQVQGPLSGELLAELCPAAGALAFYDNTATEIAGQLCVVSRTGWSGELGFEIYPLSSDGGVRIWRSVVERGERLGLMITGPNLSRALERGITDTHYYVNSGMNPYEAGRGRLVDLDHGPFVGQDALRRVQAAGTTRTTVGLICDEGVTLPPFAEFWRVEDPNGNELGIVRWGAYAFGLERSAAIAVVLGAPPPGSRVRICHPDGVAAALVTPLPLTD
jgi:glycine cleavage system aminomethyltransferase T